MLTNSERVVALLGFMPDKAAVEAALLDNGIDGTEVYVSTTYPTLRLAAISLLEILLSTPNTSNSLTGFSSTYDRSAIQSRLDILKEQAGIKAKSTIRSLKW